MSFEVYDYGSDIKNLIYILKGKRIVYKNCLGFACFDSDPFKESAIDICIDIEKNLKGLKSSFLENEEIRIAVLTIVERILRNNFKEGKNWLIEKVTDTIDLNSIGVAIAEKWPDDPNNSEVDIHFFRPKFKDYVLDRGWNWEVVGTDKDHQNWGIAGENDGKSGAIGLCEINEDQLKQYSEFQNKFIQYHVLGYLTIF